MMKTRVNFWPTLALIASCFIVRRTAATQNHLRNFWSSSLTKTTRTAFSSSVLESDTSKRKSTYMKSLFIRGGSLADELNEDGNYDSSEEIEVGGGGEDDEETQTQTTVNENENVGSIATIGNVQLQFGNNWGNSLIDHKIELTSKRTKTIGDLKKRLSRQLPGRPPILALELVFEGRILDDESIVEELFEDDDDEDYDEDDENNDGPCRKLTLNIVPPIDSKFMIELLPKLRFHSDEDVDSSKKFAVPYGTSIDSVPTIDLIDAYFLNHVAMVSNARLLSDPNTPSSPYARLESIEQARQLREDLCVQVGVEKWKDLTENNDMDDTGTITRNGEKEEWRGHRCRSGKGGVTTQLKTTLQTNLNVNWADAIKNFLLFLFFGYFGGRNSFSRHLLLWGAPLSFALQARPVKIWFKIVFYMLSNPPSIILSFLPAPHQAILSTDFESSCVTLYDEESAKSICTKLGLYDDDDDDESLELNVKDDYNSDPDSDSDSYFDSDSDSDSNSNTDIDSDSDSDSDSEEG